MNVLSDYKKSDEIKVPIYEEEITSTQSNSDSNIVDITPQDVNKIVPTEDYEGEALTIRMWVLSFAITFMVGLVNCFFDLRYPKLTIGAVIPQVMAYPFGKAWEKIIPSLKIRLPYGKVLNTNPGPFNQKEHACIYLFSNVVVSVALVITLLAEQKKFFKIDYGTGRMILMNLSCYLIAFGYSGLSLDLLVTPAESVWPGVLSNCALFKVFYHKDLHHEGTWKISQGKFFIITFATSFVWYWFPDLIAPFLSTIGAFISWCKPSSAVLGQVFGVTTGLGLFPLTFDWTEVSSLSNPLTTPFYASLCIFISFVFWIWIIMPGLYYQNYWQTAHLPIMSNALFNVDGTSYNVTKVINSDWTLNVQDFKSYSPVMLPIAFIMSIALGLATFSSMIVMFILEFKRLVYIPLKTRTTDAHNNALEKYKRLHWGFYCASLIVGLAFGFAFVSGWNDSPLGAGGFFVSILISAVLFVPLASIEARTNFSISLASFLEIIAAFWFAGSPLNLVYFYNFSFATLQHGMHLVQSAKIGHYMKVPPRSTMIVLFFAAVWSSILNPVTTGIILNNIEGICTTNAANNMTCKAIRTTFNKHLVWGLFGRHLFGVGGRYSWVLWFFLPGALLAAFIYVLRMWMPNSFIRRFNPTLFFGGAGSIPSVTGINYSTWFLTAFIFNFYIHRRFLAWWRKYNLTLAIGLDLGVAVAAILIYFCVVYTGGSSKFSWWGTTVGSTGCDADGCPYLDSPMQAPTGW